MIAGGGPAFFAGPLASMRRKWILLPLGTMLVLLVTGLALVLRLDLSALPEPGPTEVAVATRAKRFLIGRASRQGVPPPPPVSADGTAQGGARYGVECAACHGMDGQTPTENGRWMYPRAADLTSAAVQGYSDRELFWIVKNGVRFSGMPAFGEVESNERIWRIVQYLRTFRPKGAIVEAQR